MASHIQHEIAQNLDLDQLTALRKEIHQHPELSHYEGQTAERIKRFLTQYNPTEIIESIGGSGMIALWTFSEDGPAVLFRCELDALPIQEINDDLPYQSVVANVGHKCGHDGHMASVSGLAQLLHQKPFTRGKVMLLFQPAEETGEGAAEMLEDEKMKAIQPDYVFAYHNLPGYPLGEVLTKDWGFAPASAGMEVFLYGATSHAGEPERGNSPALPMSNIIQAITDLPQSGRYDGFVLTTVIHALLGEVAFGTSPGYAEVRATLRAHLDSDMEQLKQQAEAIVKQHATAKNLEHKIGYREVFPAVTNHEEAMTFLNAAIEASKLNQKNLKEPVRWSEDFGHFTNRYPGSLFCLGSGENQPALHNADYDYPDELLPVAVQLFYNIADQILREERHGS